MGRIVCAFGRGRAAKHSRQDYTGRMQHIEFRLDPGREYVELNQLLKLAGLAHSGGAGKQLVASGAVAVDGATETRKTAKIRAGQTVTFGDVAIRVTGIACGGRDR